MVQVLGLDVGTQGTKGLVVDLEAGRVVARAARAYDLLPDLPPGAAEQHPDLWEQACAEVCAELLADPAVDAAGLAAVGVSGQQHGCVLLGEDRRPLRAAKLWCDTETAPEAADLSRELGRPVPTGFTASKVRFTAAREPELWAAVRHVALPHDYLNLRLTGALCAEAGDASGTGYFDVAARDYDLAAAATVAPELPERLPPLVATGAPAGRVDAAGAARFGLPEGCLVSAGGGDNMQSAIGSGATRAGTVTVSLGTSGTVFAHADAPVLDPEGLIAPFCGSAGGWLPLLCVMNLTGVTEEVVAATGRDHGQLTALAQGVAPGCDGLLWLPYLAGERVPDLPTATGTLLGMGPGCLEPGRLYRAALEGTSLNLAWGVERLRGLGLAVDRVHLVGGAAKNLLWQQVLAAALGATVVPLAEPESAALGAALQAAWTLERQAGRERPIHELSQPFVAPAGEAREPDPELRAAYAQQLGRFRAEVARLYGAP